jgi:hypothetical protein
MEPTSVAHPDSLRVALAGGIASAVSSARGGGGVKIFLQTRRFEGTSTRLTRKSDRPQIVVGLVFF